MVLYFTGTGNSKFVAVALAEALNDTVSSMNAVMRRGESLSVYSDKPYVIVAPIHAWRYPAAVEQMLTEADLQGCKDVYCIAAMGENSGNADKALAKLFAAKGMNFKGFCGVVMPNNYIPGWDVDSEEEVRDMLTAAVPKVRMLAESIKAGKNISKDDKTPLAGLMSGLVNYGFRNFMLKNQVFEVAETCIACGVCAASCPTANIFIYDGKATFGENCTSCYSCLHRCPMQAINIKGQTENRGRYVCVEYRDWK
ncbi:MAG: EFR1 family ferrodoxin [Oscillospiraceae bacterium]|nr:EFR1 family ferrodoxin [Oscillospiraceae bacterium]